MRKKYYYVKDRFWEKEHLDKFSKELINKVKSREQLKEF